LVGKSEAVSTAILVVRSGSAVLGNLKLPRGLTVPD
jgi:hypothetical protein